MDKKEYKILSEEIMALTANEQFVEAVEIADRIDWRKVRSYSMLHKISNLYKINHRYEEAMEIIQLAYERNPNNWKILFSLCELCVELNDIGGAVMYLAKFKKIAPNEPEVYILQYEILEQQGAQLEDRIELLEEFVHKFYWEEWAYQLAYLYHRIGLATKCVETCDQLITWFGNGPFVIKAMELKMLHSKLTPKQQAVYDRRNNIADQIEAYESDEYMAEHPEPGLMPELGDEDFHVKTIDMSKFNTINLQKALADSMRELMGEEYGSFGNPVTQDLVRPMLEDGPVVGTQNLASEEDILGKYQDVPETSADYQLQEGEEILYEGEDGKLYRADGSLVEEELFFEDGTPYHTGQMPPQGNDYNNGYPEAPGGYYNNGQPETQGGYYNNGQPEAQGGYYNNGQLEAQGGYYNNGYSEVPREPLNENSIKYQINNAIQETREREMMGNYPQSPDEFGMDLSAGPKPREEIRLPESKTQEIFFEDKTGDIPLDTGALHYPYSTKEDRERALQEASRPPIDISQVNTEQKISAPVKKSGFEDVLRQGADGQISLVVPEQVMIEKQITGQMNLDEMLANWESIKHYHDEQERQAHHQTLLDKTGRLFEEFEEASKNDLLAKLEMEQRAARKVINNELEIKKVEEVGSVVDGMDHHVERISIWDEVDAAIEADKRRAAMLEDAAVATGAAMAAGAVVAGGSLAGDAAMVGGIASEAAGAVASGAALGMMHLGSAAASAMTEAPMDSMQGGFPQKKESTTESSADAGSIATEEAAANAAPQSPAAEPSEGYPEAYSEEYAEENAEVYSEEYAEENAEEYSEEYVEENAEGYSEEYLEENAEGYSEEYAEENAEAYSEEYVEENAEGYSEEYVEENAEEYSEEYAEENAEEYSEEYTEENAEEYFEEYTDDAFIDGDAQEYAEAENIEEGEASEAAEELEYAEDTDEAVKAASLDTAEINSIGSALEAAADQVGIETVDEINDEYDASNEERDFSPEELDLFADFMYSKKMRKQILDAIDMISLAAYVGNVIVTGESGTGVLEMAKDIIKEIQLTDSNFVASKVAKISGGKMNKKDIGSTLNQLANGALIIEHASDMHKDTLENITKVLETTQNGIIIVLTDDKKSMDQMISTYPVLTGYFNARVDITPMSNNALVSYAKKYAYGKEYKIDEEKAVLALHQRISELQVGEHNVTTKEIEDIVDGAISNSKKPRLSTYFSILGGKRYDYEDMIILKEKDFIR